MYKFLVLVLLAVASVHAGFDFQNLEEQANGSFRMSNSAF